MRALVASLTGALDNELQVVFALGRWLRSRGYPHLESSICKEPITPKRCIMHRLHAIRLGRAVALSMVRHRLRSDSARRIIRFTSILIGSCAVSLLVAATAKGQFQGTHFIRQDAVINDDRIQIPYVVGYANQQDLDAKTNGVSVTFTVSENAKIHSAGAFNGSVINSSGLVWGGGDYWFANIGPRCKSLADWPWRAPVGPGWCRSQRRDGHVFECGTPMS